MIFELFYTFIKVFIAFHWNQIIPDVISSSPRSLIEYKWPGVTANLGNIATPTQVIFANY